MDQLWGQNFDASSEVLDRAKNIKLALFDVDGVLTNGTLRITPDGEHEKEFNVLDGFGLKLLATKIHVGVITARRSEAVDYRMRELGIKHYYPGQENKIDAFASLTKELGLSDDQCSYMGDDVIDLPVMLRCGLSITVPNAHAVVQHYADWSTPVPGGSGAVRWACDLLLHARGDYDELVSRYFLHTSKGPDSDAK